MQTAVEWLINYCERENWSLPSDIEEIAKEMEQKKIAEAYETGWINGSLKKSPSFGHDYYIKTYNK